MKLFKKSTISLALTAAILGSVSMTSSLTAAPVVNTGNDGAGDVLLYPYYTVDNGFVTQFSVVNTSNTDTTIAKLRLRDYKDSNDVLDFTIILSPNDVFTGTARADALGNVVFTRSNDDTTCTSPLSPSRNYQPSAANANPNGLTGHAEVITMATIPDTISAATYPALAEIVNDSTHSTSTGDTPAGGCADVDSYFDLDSPGTAADSREISTLQEEYHAYSAAINATGSEAIQSTLVGSFAVVKVDGGIAASGRPTTVAGALNDDAALLVSPCDETTLAANNTILCGQVPTSGHFTFPHLLHVPGVDTSAGRATTALTAAANVTAFNVFQTELAATQIAAEWSRNPDNNVQSETVFTLPTKYVSRDDYPASTVAVFEVINNRSTSKNVLVGSNYVTTETSKWNDVDDTLNVTGVGTTTGVFTDSGANAGCAHYTRTTFDREEQTFTPSGTGTSVSGGQENEPDPEEQICNEVTTMTYGDGDGVTHDMASPVTFVLPTTSLTQTFGWAKVGLKDERATGASTSFPVIGYTMSSRELAGDSMGNFAQIINVIKIK